jgi:hypothetical protein
MPLGPSLSVPARSPRPLVSASQRSLARSQLPLLCMPGSQVSGLLRRPHRRAVRLAGLRLPIFRGGCPAATVDLDRFRECITLLRRVGGRPPRASGATLVVAPGTDIVISRYDLMTFDLISLSDGGVTFAW